MQVAAIGDSIVHGGLDDEGGGWVARLKILSCKEGSGDHVFGLGLGGNTSRDILARVEVEIRARSNHIDKVIFGTGTNDKLQSIPVAEFRENISKLAAIASGYGKRVFFMGLFLWIEDGVRVDTSAYDAAIREVCDEGGYTYIPTEDVMGQGDLVDGCHPGPSGHAKLCSRVAEYMVP
jgi:lysophospholipase L1-like esterase